MLISEFIHEGVTYNIEPPVNTGNHTIEDYAGLIAVAQKGARVDEAELRVPRLAAILVMKHSESDPLSTLNHLFGDEYQVTVSR